MFNSLTTTLLQISLGPPVANELQINKLLQALFQDFFIVGGIIYVIFSVVVIRQIAVMKRTLITSFSPVIRILGYVHLALSILVLLFYIVIL
jgi:hypothetical protein